MGFLYSGFQKNENVFLLFSSECGCFEPRSGLEAGWGGSGGRGEGFQRGGVPTDGRVTRLPGFWEEKLLPSRADGTGFPSDAPQLKLWEVKNLASTFASLLVKDSQHDFYKLDNEWGPRIPGSGQLGIWGSHEKEGPGQPPLSACFSFLQVLFSPRESQDFPLWKLSVSGADPAWTWGSLPLPLFLRPLLRLSSKDPSHSAMLV